MDVNMAGAALYPSALRAVRDRLGILVRLSPAQLTAYLMLLENERGQLYDHTVMGFPCFVDPTMEQDRIEIDIGGEVRARIINLAIPSLYMPR